MTENQNDGTGAGTDEGAAENGKPDTGADLAELQATVASLNLTPGQLKSRLEASRKWEDRAKEKDPEIKSLRAKASEYDALLAASQTDQEKAVEAARKEAAEATRTEERNRFAGRLVDAEIKATAAGRMESEQLEALLDGLDRARFLTDDGDVDTDKVTKLLDRIAPKQQKYADLGQGKRGSAPKTTDMSQLIRRAAGHG